MSTFQSEQYWYERRVFLEKAGYRLRPKFQPGFVAPACNPLLDTNAASHARPCIMDAVRISDDKLVMLKQISKKAHPFEVEIGQLFSAQPRAADPRNHCIPLLDVLHDPEDGDFQVIVMPRMIDIRQLKFETVGEVVDCFRQIFEGLQFMHENYVAHRDCARANIVMDPEQLLPHGFHPVITFFNQDMDGYAKCISRTKCWPRYYLIDFGFSGRYNLDDGPPLEPMVIGADDVPLEHARRLIAAGAPLECNPFPTDVFFAGNLLNHYFIRSHPGFGERGTGNHKPLHFLKPLVTDMMQYDPSKRPTIGEVIERFENLCDGLSDWHLRRPGQAIYCDGWIVQRCRQLKNAFKHVPPFPRDLYLIGDMRCWTTE
ncbi:hypothetical protein K438DRAFT_1927335 [Mycena galopus ATCC 62051]|nr:hypothetical protein K438DRAFT_1927335 [Mycena galopus ATCC 62051]